MNSAHFTRSRNKPASSIALTDAVSFTHGRVHELCGPARRRLAVLIAANGQGPVLWIRPAWASDKVSADGMAPLLNPARIVFVDVIRTDDLLWCKEEAVRNGEAAVVISELPEPLALTPVRRLHLAAERSGVLPLILSEGDGGSQGVETRWHMSPSHVPGESRWTITRLRARMKPPASWTLGLNDLRQAA